MKTFGQAPYQKALEIHIQYLQPSLQRLEKITVSDLNVNEDIEISAKIKKACQALWQYFETIKDKASPNVKSFAAAVQALEEYDLLSSIQKGLAFLQGYVRLLAALKTLMTLSQERPFPAAKPLFDGATFYAYRFFASYGERWPRFLVLLVLLISLMLFIYLRTGL